jgi:hypothetical protein
MGRAGALTIPVSAVLSGLIFLGAEAVQSSGLWR